MPIVRNNDVCLGSVRFNKLLVRRFDMVFPAVHDIVEVVATLLGITFHPTFEFNTVFGVDKNFQVHLISKFAEVKHKNTFDNDNWRGPKGQHTRNDIGVVKSIFWLMNDSAPAECLDMLSIQVVVDGVGQVEVVDTLIVLRNLIEGAVVIILRNKANLVIGESIQNTLQKGRFARRTAAGNADDERFGGHTGKDNIGSGLPRDRIGSR